MHVILHDLILKVQALFNVVIYFGPIGHILHDFFSAQINVLQFLPILPDARAAAHVTDMGIPFHSGDMSNFIGYPDAL